MKKLGASILEAFEELDDPRSRVCPHPLDEILLLALCAIISGAESWVAVSRWGNLKIAWLRETLPYANGIPTHDTLGRVFSVLNARQFESCFIRWMQGICPNLEGQHIAIDGKTVRGSHAGKSSAIHLVSAWSSKLGLTLGQTKTAKKSNEITAIPDLIDGMDIRGSIVTIDAMGCQHAIADKIIAHEAHYVFGVKDNQARLAEAIRLLFDAQTNENLDRQRVFLQCSHTEKDHGRIETRRCVVTGDVAWLKEQGQNWTGLNSIVMVESTREMIGRNSTGKPSTERRYYISSLAPDAELLNRTIRAHWGIENKLHWVLDVAFREDDSRVRCGEAPQNFAILRRIALNLLKQETTTKVGINTKRLMAGWEMNYLAKILGL